MEIIFYNPSFTDDIDSEVEDIVVSEKLFERLAKTEFSKIGVSEPLSINIDGEMIEVVVVKVTPIIRRSILLYFGELLFNVVSERIGEGEDIAREKYKDYLRDEVSIVELIRMFGNERFTLVQR
ncbi:hypothetical protein HL658_03545 [Azospirillum sp. RWY-5-1]|uniref:Uncharacterized protein n=1 Tax=Azospirillum oleiclasticum TaxID=2735135 RepID=A0ABX2T653_9PROT|nr:hypothetical protein [Azospirillum oleiclasticum]NYZ11611.1 hypothetical protein [Azospirillum oleiclasticum]NYZ18772.1 hypothetical protein [Azospirillum oleiclasticum]